MAKIEMTKPASEQINVIQKMYEGISYEALSAKVAEIVTPANMKAELQIIYQSVENLHKACEGYRGDWYFTGNYPTHGGTKVANRAFLYYIEGRTERAY
jgi:amidophosphoribosyltransferase